ncbi:NAD(P)-dependent oxidoreductase [Streptomyces sp. SAJ15]|uniref:NAD-dependent epimerase/dehydratase family protein n=1 Tax=Streptomyces sp. SAJ15 TaxID=2011095 RepID=UPI0011858A3A|nr:NAD(P)-dependent oxidoreductase [Streptomyces sp. SAJ15]TVL89466.1 NarL family transcriptional regulator [Streptomyces sp. SAJ15]
MRILVLGSTGFLGGHTVEQLRALPGVRVLLGGRAPGAEPHIDLATTPLTELTATLRDLDPDAVVNCAGAVGGAAPRLAEVNARGPAVLAEALWLAAPEARLVHLGSAAEYGVTEAGRGVAETTPARPVSLYGATKLAGTLAVTGSSLDAVVLRVFNPVGPGAAPASLPGRLAAELRRTVPGEPGATVAVGDLSAHRDFVDARDVALAAALAATAPRQLPRVLNIGSGTARPVREVAEQLVRVSGFRGRIGETLDTTPGAERSGAVSWQRAEIAAAGEALDWRPRYAFAESLADLWAATVPAAGPPGADPRSAAPRSAAPPATTAAPTGDPAR